MTEALLDEFAPPSPFEPPVWVAGELERPTGKGLTVAVVDSGWDRACNDPRVLPGVGLVDPDDDLALQENLDDHDRVGHGTACIHQILRIAPDARVIPIRVFGNSLETSPHTLQTAIRVAIEKGVNVVNLSLGTRLEGTLKMLYAACEYARRQGIIIVAAGDNSREWSYPAIFENVIGVSAGRFESPYQYRYLVDEAHECQAWGIEQPVVWLGGEEQVKHGTSFAAPNITGIVCLLLERHPGASLEQIRELLSKYAMETVAADEEPSPLSQMVTTGARDAGLARKPGSRKLTTEKKASAATKAAGDGKTAAGKKPAAKKSASKAAVETKASKKPASTRASGAKTSAAKADVAKPSSAKPRAKKAGADQPSSAKPASTARKLRTTKKAADDATAAQPSARKRAAESTAKPQARKRKPAKES